MIVSIILSSIYDLKDMTNTCILIPSYKPTIQLVEIVKQLRHDYTGNIVVVDDGNGTLSSDVFNTLIDQYKVHVCHHFSNLGKGRALKTGFNYILIGFPDCEWVITADSDGRFAAARVPWTTSER